MEEYKQLINYPNYEFSNLGNVKNIKTNRILKTPLNTSGYPCVCINKIKIQVHILIAKCFIENPLNYNEIDHIDRDKTNNNINNLRWISHHINCINRGKRPNTTSQYKGICFDKSKNKFIVSIKQQKYGAFKTEEEAYEKRCEIIESYKMDINFII